MSTTITQVKEHLTGMGHGGTLDKVRNIEALFHRAGNKLLSVVDPVDAIRVAALSQTVHDRLYNYALPSDFGAMIDLYPQAGRTSHDEASRILARPFDRRKLLDNRVVSIESSEASKLLRINWQVRAPKVLNSMDTYNGNGTWSAVTGAANVETDNIYKYSGGGSVRFDLTATGGGIQNTTMTRVDLTDEDELASIIVPVYLPSITGITSISTRFGNDLTDNYWTPTAQTTQADGTALRVGWNVLRFAWYGATETGTVDPSTIDAFRLTIAGSSAISDIRVDNILFAIGYPFELKYYSKYLFKNSAGTWIARPTSDDDVVVLDDDGLNLFLYECLIAMAQQMEGTDSAFDVEFARTELATLYPSYSAKYPSQALKPKRSYGMLPRFQR